MPYHDEAAASAKSSLRSAGEGLGIVGAIGGVADYLEGNGLDKAEAAAGEVLRPLFGGQVPWEMSADEIVDAVVPNFLPDVIPGASGALSNEAALLMDTVTSLF